MKTKFIKIQNKTQKGSGLIACQTDEHKKICFESITYLSL